MKIIGKCLNHICDGDKAEIDISPEELARQLKDIGWELKSPNYGLIEHYKGSSMEGWAINEVKRLDGIEYPYPQCSCENPKPDRYITYRDGISVQPCLTCGKPIPVPRECKCQDHSYVCGLDIPKGNTKPEPKIEKLDLSLVYTDRFLANKFNELIEAINKLNGKG